MSRREHEATQSVKTYTPADCHSSSKVGLSPPLLYNLSSPASEDISLGPLIPCSFKPKETVHESVLEASVSTEENGQHRTQCPELTCSDDVADLPPVVKTETDLDIVQVDAKQKELSNMAVDFDLALVTERMAVLRGDGEALVDKEEEEGGPGGKGRRFRAKIDPASNNQAEEELRKQIR